ncbi:histidinol-phosphate transaminase [Candidatus Nitrospira inopinata]|uniref:Histidinol-phosphate aminotransferase n=1 Tax=Candidatus Nitrospira inopinata TaxID=1715989 RepID=A0A0S4KQI1_9BACT|nr:histidinol-phosphate transaminase [Candidatus Nitrospira inopinata]CUQ66261.1 Histidinol-phosphate aminotransferase [Candidatus Nitrospira inopinata]
MALYIHPDIRSLTPYVPGKPIEELQRELGLDRVIKLASNENPIGPSSRALAALAGATDNLHRYPDGGGHRLRQVLAERWKVSSEQIIVGNGSDELLGLLARAFLAPGDDAVMADHTFVIYRMEVTAAHGNPIVVPLTNWTHDLDAMARAVTPRTRLLFVCNPNNPTGTMVSAEEVERLMASVPNDVVVVFDEAYFEYVRDPRFPDTIAYVRDGRNAVVLRTFSKIYGLAGLRIGYGITTPEIAGILNRIRPPFNANSLAQRAAAAALGDEEHVARSRSVNAEGMAQVSQGLEALGLTPIPSQTNFLYFDVGRDGRQVFEALLREGIIVRHIEGTMLRVTIGLADENAAFLQALKRVLACET